MTLPPGGGRSLILLAAALVLGGCARATYDTHDDFTISTHVKIALLDDARLGGFRINATTAHGVVTLSGTVDARGDVDRAIGIARKVRGVRDVKSELKVSSQLPVISFQLPVSICQWFPVPGAGSRLQVSGSRFCRLFECG